MKNVKAISPDGEEIYIDNTADIGVLHLERVGTYTIRFIVSGEENLEDLLEELDVRLNENDEEEQVDSTTVGGFVTEQMNKIPTEGESFEFKNLSVEITKASSTKVEEIRVKVNPVEEEE